ncbi:MAG: di-trans,poly-cis-decaprenylcistransferase [Spirochaetaceae bacterium]|nr:MAG: di-trans,poly-cis-decaprenylcistransferase [Spirochaetaceae bacterium]
MHSGDLKRLPRAVQNEVRGVIKDTREFNRIIVNLALNYGGRDEILRSVNRIWARRLRDSDGTPLDANQLRKALDLPDLPDPDLVIRTGGERRLSNFLLWQCAYAELYFCDKLWPDWGYDDYLAAVRDYCCRKRNFGGSR